jgi:tRNA A-37 threonylcarbamoyl transferase component Bud32
MTTENPYFHRGPIKHPNYFYGRTQEVTGALSLLKNSQSVSIVGPRRIGKTSLLLHISHPQVMALHGLSPAEYIFVFIDCGGLSDLDQAGFYRLILEETEDQLLAQEHDINLSLPETVSYRHFERTLRRLSRQNLKLIFLLDEFELMSENHRLDADFFSGLRGLTARTNICYVTTSQAHLLELSYAEGVLGSPFFNIFAVQNLGLFAEADAHQLIRTPARQAGVEFSERMAADVLALVGPHPMFLNIACFHLLAALYKLPASRNGNWQAVQELARPNILAELDGHLRYYWSKLNVQEQEALLSLGQARRGDTTQVLFHQLERKGLVVKDKGGFRFPSAVLAEFVAQQAIAPDDPTIRLAAPDSGDSNQPGAYQIVEQIGQGGMATVYRGIHTALNRDVAIKRLAGHLAKDREFRERFHREAQALAALRHLHIVQVFDFGADANGNYMVMEYIAGGTLRERLDRLNAARQLMPLPEVTAMATDIAAALDYAHTQGVVHRDLKPANVMLTAQNHAVLTDFGLARIAGSSHQTATGTSFGTPVYMSPEQAQGGRGDKQSDIYSFGIILFELLTGQTPFDGDSPLAVMMQHVNIPPPRAESLNPELPAALGDVLARALAKKPVDRYATAGDLAHAFCAAAGVVAVQTQ